MSLKAFDSEGASRAMTASRAGSPAHVMQLLPTAGLLTLEDVVGEPPLQMAETISRQPQAVIDGLKEKLCQLLSGGAEKRSAFTNLQKIVRKRLPSLTPETLMRITRAQLEILVAIRTGIQGFLHPDISIDNKVLLQIFLQKRCRNIACQAALPANDCACRACSSDSGFCNMCMCISCFTFDFEANTCRWVGCDFCLHWCHSDCALQLGGEVGITAFHVVGVEDLQYLCPACGHASELFGFVSDVFQNCAGDWKRENLEKELACVERIFLGSRDPRGKRLTEWTQKLRRNLEAGMPHGDVCKMMQSFFIENHAPTGDRSIPSAALNMSMRVVRDPTIEGGGRLNSMTTSGTGGMQSATLRAAQLKGPGVSVTVGEGRLASQQPNEIVQSEAGSSRRNGGSEAAGTHLAAQAGAGAGAGPGGNYLGLSPGLLLQGEPTLVEGGGGGGERSGLAGAEEFRAATMRERERRGSNTTSRQGHPSHSRDADEVDGGCRQGEEGGGGLAGVGMGVGGGVGLGMGVGGVRVAEGMGGVEGADGPVVVAGGKMLEFLQGSAAVERAQARPHWGRGLKRTHMMVDNYSSKLKELKEAAMELHKETEIEEKAILELEQRVVLMQAEHARWQSKADAALREAESLRSLVRDRRLGLKTRFDEQYSQLHSEEAKARSTSIQKAFQILKGSQEILEEVQKEVTMQLQELAYNRSKGGGGGPLEDGQQDDSPMAVYARDTSSDTSLPAHAPNGGAGATPGP